MRRLAACCWLGLTLAAGSVGAQTTALDRLRDEQAAINGRYLLRDPQGRAVTNEDFRGRFQLVAFGYTACPDVCPTTLVDMAAVLKQLGEHARQVQAIFITVDPERDTGEVLKTYTAFFDPRILGLTGTPALVRRAADGFAVRYAKVRENGAAAGHYAVDHSAGMFVLGPNGEYLRRYAYGTPAGDIAAQLKSWLDSR